MFSEFFGDDPYKGAYGGMDPQGRDLGSPNYKNRRTREERESEADERWKELEERNALEKSPQAVMAAESFLNELVTQIESGKIQTLDRDMAISIFEAHRAVTIGTPFKARLVAEVAGKRLKLLNPLTPEERQQLSSPARVIDEQNAEKTMQLRQALELIESLFSTF